MVLLPSGVESGCEETDHAKLAAGGEKTGAVVACGSKAAENEYHIEMLSSFLLLVLHLGKTEYICTSKQNGEESIYTYHG
jgi:hypothetical protein